MKFILIIVFIGADYRPTPFTQEFDNKEACLRARTVMYKAWDQLSDAYMPPRSTLDHLRALECVPKG